jgi:predicted enzyme related to lactoylglutathione lyase
LTGPRGARRALQSGPMKASRRPLAPLMAAAFLSACANNPQTESTGPRIEALGVTTIYAADPGRLADWYASRFRVVFRLEGSGYVSKDTTQLGPIWIVINKAQGPNEPKPIEIFYFVRNLDRVLGQLSEVGTSPLRLDTDGEGRPTAIVVDPEGNRIELVQR